MAVKKDTAPGLLLAHSWDEEQDMSGWWMSEKLDGVRAYWDGTRLLSRLGNEFYAPAWWLKGFPKEPLDGELWSGRGCFQKIVGTVKRHDGGDLWKEIKYLVFDAPPSIAEALGPLYQTTFEHRLAKLARLTLKAPVISMVKQTRCRDNHHLRCSLGEVIKQRGEGLMLRQPESLYVPKRSNTLLKVKTTQTAEGVVVGHEPGKGKHKGRMGALVVSLRPIGRMDEPRKPVGGKLLEIMQRPTEQTVCVGTGFTDHERENPPKIGSVITYRFQELTDGGVPRFPAYVGIRRVS